MLIANRAMPPYYQMSTLIFQFWLSGMWILSLIFTVDSHQIDYTNLWMFVTLGVCYFITKAASLLGGYASDLFGRILVYKIGAAVWLLGAGLSLVSVPAGYIVTAGSIGLLNNLTFVIVMQNFPEDKNIYTIYVLMGWASSQIFLGIIFYLIQKVQHFFVLLFLLTLVHTVAAMLFVQNLHPQNMDKQVQAAFQDENQNQNKIEYKWYQKIMPHSVKPLIGGCVLMFVMQMFYYRTQFTLDRFGVSLQLNTIVVGITQFSANVIFTKFINRFPRRTFIRIFLIVLALLFVVLIITNNKILQTFVEGIMRLFDTFIMIILGVYLPQLFQKDERGKGTNYIMSFGVLGSALNSIILNNLKFWQLIFFLLAGFLSTVLFKQTLPSRTKNQQQQILLQPN